MSKPIYEKRPELFEGMDCRPGNSYPADRIDAVTPDYIKKLIAERQQELRSAQPEPSNPE